MGQILNDLIRRKAREFGWHFVDVDADFRGRGYCAPEAVSYWVKAEQSCDRQGNFDGTMHPNDRGHAMYGLRLAESLMQHTVTPPRITVGDLTRPPEGDTGGTILDTPPKDHGRRHN